MTIFTKEKYFKNTKIKYEKAISRIGKIYMKL